MYKLYSQRILPDNHSRSFEYNNIPLAFIEQYFYIAEDFFNHLPKPLSEPHRYWEAICRIFCLERGIPLIGEDSESYREELGYFLKSVEATAVDILDVIELTFADDVILGFDWLTLQEIFSTATLPQCFHQVECVLAKEQAIKKINDRFVQHNLGYELVNGQIIRKDSELLTKEVVEPAFAILHDQHFSSAEEELQKAFRFRRNGDNAECIVNALKAFESTMKIICSRMNYPFDPTRDAAQKLLQKLVDNSFFPFFLSTHMTSLRTTLETGLPTLRNKTSGHGAGDAPTNISDEFADYALHLATTNIVLLVDLFNKKQIKP